MRPAAERKPDGQLLPEAITAALSDQLDFDNQSPQERVAPATRLGPAVPVARAPILDERNLPIP